ncbi:MAG: hypothetical protein HC817_00510, partial [Saprospiraceae bacterium]|nr:hypothetical protein [Saprospiraceae bacterium]
FPQTPQTTKKKDIKSLTQAYSIMRLMDSLLLDALVSANDETLLSYQKDFGAKNYDLAQKIAFSLYKETHQMRYLEFGFMLSERFKSQVLFRNLTDAKIDSGSKPLVDSIKTLKAEMAFFQNKEDKIATQLALRERLEQLYQDLEKRNPEYYKSKILQPVAALKQIQDFLKPTQLLVNYNMTEAKTYRILISKTGCAFQTLEGVKVLNAQISQLRAFLTSKTNTYSGKAYKKNCNRIV